mmetsp:Transcript_12337/g.18708  ORF Transcript_12337/g.18708 Transcript_12337/m.18708 type:complete len:134 (+) Transcript_12337:400-801(+)
MLLPPSMCGQGSDKLNAHEHGGLQLVLISTTKKSGRSSTRRWTAWAHGLRQWGKAQTGALPTGTTTQHKSRSVERNCFCGKRWLTESDGVTALFRGGSGSKQSADRRQFRCALAPLRGSGASQGTADRPAIEL